MEQPRRYEGEWRDNCLHGRGILTLPDGRKFSGSFRHNAPENGVLEEGAASLFVRFGDDEASGSKDSFWQTGDLLQPHHLPKPKSVRELGRIPAALHMAITVCAASSYRARGAAELSIADRIVVKELHYSSSGERRQGLAEGLHVPYGSGAEAPAQILQAFTTGHVPQQSASHQDALARAQASMADEFPAPRQNLYLQWGAAVFDSVQRLQGLSSGQTAVIPEPGERDALAAGGGGDLAAKAQWAIMPQPALSSGAGGAFGHAGAAVAGSGDQDPLTQMFQVAVQDLPGFKLTAAVIGIGIGIGIVTEVY